MGPTLLTIHPLQIAYWLLAFLVFLVIVLEILLSFLDVYSLFVIIRLIAISKNRYFIIIPNLILKILLKGHLECWSPLHFVLSTLLSDIKVYRGCLVVFDIGLLDVDVYEPPITHLRRRFIQIVRHLDQYRRHDCMTPLLLQAHVLAEFVFHVGGAGFFDGGGGSERVEFLLKIRERRLTWLENDILF